MINSGTIHLYRKRIKFLGQKDASEGKGDRFKRQRVQREEKRARTRPADGSNQHSSLITIWSHLFLGVFPVPLLFT